MAHAEVLDAAISEIELVQPGAVQDGQLDAAVRLADDRVHGQQLKLPEAGQGDEVDCHEADTECAQQRHVIPVEE